MRLRVPGARRARDRGGSAGSLRGDFPQRGHDKFPFAVARMRDAQSGDIHYTLAIQNNVKVDGTRTPPVSRYPAQLALELLQGLQQGKWFQLCTDLGDGVEKT